MAKQNNTTAPLYDTHCALRGVAEPQRFLLGCWTTKAGRMECDCRHHIWYQVTCRDTRRHDYHVPNPFILGTIYMFKFITSLYELGSMKTNSPFPDLSCLRLQLFTQWLERSQKSEEVRPVLLGPLFSREVRPKPGLWNEFRLGTIQYAQPLKARCRKISEPLA